MAKHKKRKGAHDHTYRRDKFAGVKQCLLESCFAHSELLVEQNGLASMSDVPVDFMSPYTDLVKTETQYRLLVTLAVLAWNASSLPDPQQQTMIDKVVAAGGSDFTAKTLEQIRSLVQALIARKYTQFAQNTRKIIAFDRRGKWPDYILSVASTTE